MAPFLEGCSAPHISTSSILKVPASCLHAFRTRPLQPKFSCILIPIPQFRSPHLIFIRDLLAAEAAKILFNATNALMMSSSRATFKEIL